ncbi:hypothetical protein [Tenacibaculum retecalamus]|uniref:hypothetical protein n=1 Tax=Tenacibaculum retecalamus TaxID=3018315 RepID=UPI0023D8FF3E|nr:hypothetical protein [Tenacibaculum retecalamus]WBX71522.1 hypothetical protein PG912_01655 [Tenacibaculum retecalamus]
MSITTNGVTLNLVQFLEFDTNIPAANKPSGPLVNVSEFEKGNNVPYILTVLAYLPSNTLNPVENTSGLPLKGNTIYLNYYGIKPTTILKKDGTTGAIQCRDFRVEFNCDEETTEYDLYYVQFTYQINDGSSTDAVLLRDDDEDPELDRGTVTTPIKVPPTSLI